jgi:hypothetical protein
MQRWLRQQSVLPFGATPICFWGGLFVNGLSVGTSTHPNGGLGSCTPARTGIHVKPPSARPAPRLARVFHQGHDRVGCNAVRWQEETTMRARAREEEQRCQRAAAQLNRVCSGRYKLDLALEAKKVSIHEVSRGHRRATW